MKNQLTSSIENALMKLTFKEKNFIYTIARLEYRIWKALTKLEIVNKLITEEQENITSLNAAIAAAGKGKVADKLIVWKTKAEYKLFKLNLRKNKIDVTKIIINQSKLAQTKAALKTIEADILQFEEQQFKSNSFTETPITNNASNILFNDWQNHQHQNASVKASLTKYFDEALKMAS